MTLWVIILEQKESKMVRERFITLLDEGNLELIKKMTGVFFYRVIQDLDENTSYISSDNDKLLIKLGVSKFSIDEIYRTIQSTYLKEDFKIHGDVDVVESFNWIEEVDVVAYYRDI